MDKRQEQQQESGYRPRSLRTRSRKPLWLWLICGILLCQMAGITAWSSYRKKLEGKGTAVVASLVTDAEFSMDVKTLPAKPGESTAMNFMVTNYEGDRVSETLLQYKAKPETAGNLPLKFYLAPNETGVTVDDSWIAEGNIEGNSESGPGLLRQGEKTTHHYTLTISWPIETGDSDEEYADEIDYVKVNIHANQVSPK